MGKETDAGTVDFYMADVKTKALNMSHSCPVCGRRCHKCHRMNHFAKLCRSGQVSTISKHKETSNGKQWYMVGTINVVVSYNECFSTLDMNRVVVKIDTGSQVNVSPWNIIKQISKKPNIHTAKVRLIR